VEQRRLMAGGLADPTFIDPQHDVCVDNIAAITSTVLCLSPFKLLDLDVCISLIDDLRTWSHT
jgi:hypothetical protein